MRRGPGRISILLVAVAFATSVLPSAAAGAEPTIDCADDQHCRFPSPQECASGQYPGVWDGGPPGRGAICVGGAGHNVVYVGGEPTQLCGAVIVADVNIVDGPTTKMSSDPNACPHLGWPTEVHDPTVVKYKRTYYLFGTGPGIPMWRSNDLRKWHPTGSVFPSGLPQWATAISTVPWAPDISFFAGRWHIYYTVSTFGSKTSAIGLATSPTLDPEDPDYGWTDRGAVVRSDDTTDHNAIDPNVILDRDGRPWLDFGSFWTGIKLVSLDPATGKPSDGALIQPLASRLVPTWGIEAPIIVRRAGLYYLFVSFDNCCRGSESTYNIRVGRSSALAGPYVDDRGVPLLAGGGRLVLEGQGTKRGPGHQAVINDGGTWRLFFHYYDATAQGTAKLGILPIAWTPDGWPRVDWSELRAPRMMPSG